MQRVWIVQRFEDNDDPTIVNVCDSLEAAKLAREVDREDILEDDYRPWREPGEEVECPHMDPDEECHCYDENDNPFGYEWTITEHYVIPATSFIPVYPEK